MNSSSKQAHQGSRRKSALGVTRTEILSAPQPDLKINQVASLLKVSRRTVSRMIQKRQLRKQRGRIPAEQVRPFIS